MVKGKLIRWAIDRIGLTNDEVAKKLKMNVALLEKWEKEEEAPPYKKLKDIAKVLKVPFGYLFLSKPPVENLDIPDFRTHKGQQIKKFSPDLTDVIYDAQAKQEWFSEYRKVENFEPVINRSIQLSNEEIVKQIRKITSIKEIQKRVNTFEDCLKEIIETLVDKSYLVIRNGVVGHNNHRPLNPEEFRGFALFDEYAPLIFINNKDSKAGQIFTVIHELAHLQLGEDGIDGGFHYNTEQTCNKIAAEVLIPENSFPQRELLNYEEEIAKQFKVSVYVVLIRARQLGIINQEQLINRLEYFKNKIRDRSNTNRGSGGGDFYKNIKFKSGGELFLRAVIASTIEGKTLYRDAYNLTGLSNKTFNAIAEDFGYIK